MQSHNGPVYIAGYEGPERLHPIEKLLLQWQGCITLSDLQAHHTCLIAALLVAQISCLDSDASSSPAAHGPLPNHLLRVLPVHDGEYVDLIILRQLGGPPHLLGKDPVLPVDLQAEHNPKLLKAIVHVTEENQPPGFLPELVQICTDMHAAVQRFRQAFTLTITEPVFQRALEELWTFEKFEGFLQGIEYYSGLSDPR